MARFQSGQLWWRRGRVVANLRKKETDGQDVVAYITGAKTQPEYEEAA